ncbi:FkbM family methyltransferase [Humitalea rosea]|uniref:FkbM family methyltransferase n=1 Tax=Humitalea rosea TaxID=990373 RepID=A0A2W7IGN7_9PROT|nr:FkbM family methyltransferase [Humitalea rosea]PZW45721.1 FkbM family methyltransferase [Humitalea rosea]
MDEVTFHSRLHQPGTMLDVGAHDGLLTLPFSRLPASKVLAFEPLPRAFARLAAVLADGHGGAVPAHVTLHPEALGDHDGVITLSLPVLDGVPQEQWASTAKDYAGYDLRRIAVEQIRVPLRTIDGLGLTDLTHLKIDAEGAEYEVLRGARETLRRCRPVITVEIEERHRAGSTWAVPAFLDALEYEVLFELEGRWFPVAALDRATMQRASPDPSVFEASHPYVFIFYALPREQAVTALTLIRNT